MYMRFVKDNFLASGSVRPAGRRLLMASAEHTYSRLSAQRVQAADGRQHTVLFLLTGRPGGHTATPQISHHTRTERLTKIFHSQTHALM